jgi:hypothetical protein
VCCTYEDAWIPIYQECKLCWRKSDDKSTLVLLKAKLSFSVSGLGAAKYE